MPYKPKFSTAKYSKKAAKPVFRRSNALADLRTKRVATAAVYKAIKRVSEKKFDIFNTSAFPQAPGGSATGTTNVAGVQWGSVYQNTAGLVPLVAELTRYHTGGAGQTDLIGNSCTYDSMKVEFFCQPLENQSTFDQVNFRFTVLQLRQRSYLPQSVSNNSVFVKNLMLGGMSTGSGTGTSVSQLTSHPWDLDKVKVLADECKYIHATPTTVTAQANCHFKQVHFMWEKVWPKGLVINYDSAIDFTSTTQTLNPIVVICQCMEPVQTGPVSQTMTFGLTTDSIIVTKWRDM